MENFKNKEQKPSKKDQYILDHYYKTKINEEGEESQLPLADLASKKEIWSLNKMENLVRNDETLSNRYNDMAVDGAFKFGYHWNEVIMNILFNEYVLADRRYLERYKNTKEVPKKRRGNPDGVIDDNDFVDYKPNKTNKDEKNKKVMKKKTITKPKKEDIEETTSASSSGSYASPVAFAKDKSNWRFGNKVPPHMPPGSVLVESEDYLTNPKMFENIINQLEEEKRHSALVMKDRLGKDNEKNFYSDLKINKEISDSVKNGIKKPKIDKPKTLADLEKEQMGREFKPVKFDQKEDFISEYDKITKGMEDLDYDIEPSENFVERAKKDMGDDMYNKGRERVKMKSEQPLYNKDTQPTEDSKSYKKKFQESHSVSGKYTDQFNRVKLVDFRLDESVHTENTDNYNKLSFTGIGNTYSNKGELNESVKTLLEDYEFYYDSVNDSIYHTNKNIQMDESIDISKYNHLMGYNTKKFISTKKIK